MTSGTNGWPVAAPEEVGLNSASLCALKQNCCSYVDANIHSVLVVRRGTLVYEQYFEGEDQNWDRQLGRVAFHAGLKHDLRSVTKSVTSLLIGIAVQRKLVEGVDEPILQFFPEYSDLRTPEKDRILLRHLLTMSTGLAWDEYRPYTDPMNSEVQMMQSPDRYRFALERPVLLAPGQVWNYNGGATELLGALFQKIDGRLLDDFAREFLFKPLEITDTEWNKYGERDIPAAASGLRLQPRDMAKIGQLVLARGIWKGQQIVPAEWIDQSIAPQIGCPDTIYFHGYHWWLGRSFVSNREVKWAAGVGLGGQRIFIVPVLDLVVVVTAGLYNSPIQHWLPLHILNRYVLAAIKD
jgi:CubicO group peptidase (beta-lactamase class C family)